MTEFVLIAAVMVAVGLIVLLPPLLRAPRATAAADQRRASVAILKEQLADLERDHATGRIDSAAYAETHAELERRVLEEASATDGGTATASAPRWIAVALALAIPVAAGLMYARFGDSAALNPALMAVAGGGDPHSADPAQMQALTETLEKHLEREPKNVDGWYTLARTYYQMGQFDKAARAYGRLIELVPDNADLLADQADALAMAQGRKIAGEPLKLVEKALKIDPTQWKALAIAGTEAFERQDYKGAVDYWERLQASLPADAPIAQQISGSIAEARKLAGMPPAPPLAQSRKLPPVAAGQPLPRDHPPIAAPAGDPAAKSADAATGKATVAGTVTLGADLKAKAAPTDMVIVFARAAQGSRMPLAMKTLQVKDLPAKFTLDETMAMSPNMTLATAAEVIVGARVSKTGAPMPNPGDLEGLSAPVKVGAQGVAVTIDRVLP
ncbi:MAG: c-type cytochrome biogenesis protein CcmI [Betaproteobacteria bacterium]